MTTDSHPLNPDNLLFSPPQYPPDVYRIAQKLKMFSVSHTISLHEQMSMRDPRTTEYYVTKNLSQQLAYEIVKYNVEENGGVKRTETPDVEIEYRLGLIVTTQWEILELLSIAYRTGQSNPIRSDSDFGSFTK